MDVLNEEEPNKNNNCQYQDQYQDPDMNNRLQDCCSSDDDDSSSSKEQRQKNDYKLGRRRIDNYSKMDMDNKNIKNNNNYSNTTSFNNNKSNNDFTRHINFKKPTTSLLWIMGILILLFGASLVNGNSHRHRLHHGDDHARLSRARRMGRETLSPYYTIDNGHVTDLPTFKIGDTQSDSSSNGGQHIHKPTFRSCENYRPEIYENELPGTSVIRALAEDMDPPESGGTLTYSIVSNDQTLDAFAVDPQSGWLTTRKTFDRDEPVREKEVYVTVRATDNGRPQLDAVCTMKVKILDVNDNRPMYDKYEYKESIPRDQAVNQVVLRISATDIDDGDNGTIVYSLEPHPEHRNDITYFEIVPQSGEVKLKKPIDENKPLFYITAVASDRGNPPLSSKTNLSIEVVDSNKKSPTFINNFSRRIELSEKFSEKNEPIVRIEALANTNKSEDGILFFELVSGQTEPTNKGKVFTLEQESSSKNVALLKLDKDLDYETVSEYTLTIRAVNKYNLAAETIINIIVTDENDEKPTFQDVYEGTVLENEPAGTSVMRVRAIDLDGTSPNNLVKLALQPEDEEFFQINPDTGDITTRTPFDRETKDVYQLRVIARDGAPSYFLKNGQPNERPLTLKINIADKNDNPPRFLREEYRAEINEDANINAKVIEIKAYDKDTASVITYSIDSGNVGDVFDIWPGSGIVYVKNSLDYETRTHYELTIKASDGVSDAKTKVIVDVMNINDNPPQFDSMTTNKTIEEETIPHECIFQVSAYDPDIGDRSQPQNISYFIESGEDHFSVDKHGCVRVAKPLDRDRGTGGFPWKSLRVGAKDEWGLSSSSLIGYQDLTVTLTDVNDNAPKLNCTNPVVWLENMPRGEIIKLTAEDYDSDENGPPFQFAIDPAADNEIKTWFSVRDKWLHADKDNFDREERKEYQIPILISDSGTPLRQTGTSTLTVIIGDENDNDMKDGNSKIFVYKYKPPSPFTIGRVYITDPDDWDLPDKSFEYVDGKTHPKFNVDPHTGDITMKPDTAADTYTLRFTVKDHKWNSNATGVVEITVKQIPEEAVLQSGSIRFEGKKREEFIKPDPLTGKSKIDILKGEIANLFGINEENVDVFTVINSPHNPSLSVVDVRYSAHGSPYYKSERLDGMIGQHKELLEKALQTNILMIRVDECISEKQHCESSCTNKLIASEIPYKIATNTSSFVGVEAYVDPVCTCASSIAPNSCLPNPCLNNGICRSGGGMLGFTCECETGLNGPRCEDVTRAFDKESYAWYSPLSVCNDSSLTFEINTYDKSGIILYNGPLFKPAMDITDFVSIELLNGRPVLLIDYGSGTSKLELRRSPDLADGKTHKVYLHWNPSRITLQVDDCPRKDESCFNHTRPIGANSFLNVNGPLQLGGLSMDLVKIGTSMRWSYIPTAEKFLGCVSNLTFNGEYYDLAKPSWSVGNLTSCDSPRMIATKASLGVDLNFIIILLVCILILFILVIAIVFYRRRRSYEEVKGDPHDDVRENIINYSDEGGGEGDQTGYDLSVLMKATANGPYTHSPTDKILMDDLQRQVPQTGDGPDIQSFLQGNKNKVDNDPDGLPYDDVRNYAYEGDGNSMGSLSSLASGTDDGDLNFDHLTTFGPRFKKLADMYGGNSSDEDSYPPEDWC